MIIYLVRKNDIYFENDRRTVRVVSILNVLILRGWMFHANNSFITRFLSISLKVNIMLWYKLRWAVTTEQIYRQQRYQTKLIIYQANTNRSSYFSL